LLVALADGVLDTLPLARVEPFRAALGSWLAENCPEALALDDRVRALPEATEKRLKAALAELARHVREPAAGAVRGVAS
ncbi:MAG: hypothetical protein JO021_07670, partial [Alphaproteobacteria bacterium]|nr:hypothetical protein [Alphaproteobacteria bacterium]